MKYYLIGFLVLMSTTGLLIFDGVVKSKVVAKFDAAIGLYLDRGRVAVYATHYKELSENPEGV